MTDQRSPRSELIPHQTEEEEARIQCRSEDETLWLMQIHLAKLFQTSVPNINTHLKGIYAADELSEAATIKSGLIVRHEGARRIARKVEHPRRNTVHHRLDEFFSKVEFDATPTIRQHRIVRSKGARHVSRAIDRLNAVTQ